MEYNEELEKLVFQIQNLELQINEIDSVLEEIKNKDEVYELVGNLMIKKKKEDVENKLNEKKELLEFKLTSLKKKLNNTPEKKE
ncbi:MAG: prefoldin subunit [Candidatus Woesearchaeota archaeon]